MSEHVRDVEGHGFCLGNLRGWCNHEPTNIRFFCECQHLIHQNLMSLELEALETIVLRVRPWVVELYVVMGVR